MIDGIRYIVMALILIVTQFLLLQEINFGTWVKPMPYVYLIFILPFEMNRYVKLIIAFLLGFALDAVGNTYGMHAAATTLLAFTRIYTDKWFLDTDAIQLQGFNYLSPDYKSFTYYATYVGALVFIHHFVLFTLNYFRFTAMFTVILVSLFSSIATFLFILLYRIIGKHR